MVKNDLLHKMFLATILKILDVSSIKIHKNYHLLIFFPVKMDIVFMLKISPSKVRTGYVRGVCRPDSLVIPGRRNQASVCLLILLTSITDEGQEACAPSS